MGFSNIIAETQNNKNDVQKKFELAILYLAFFLHALCYLYVVQHNTTNINSALGSISSVLGLALTILFCYIANFADKKKILILSSILVVIYYIVSLFYPLNTDLIVIFKNLAPYMVLVSIIKIQILEKVQEKSQQPISLEAIGLIQYLASFFALFFYTAPTRYDIDINLNLVFKIIVILIIVSIILICKLNPSCQKCNTVSNNNSNNATISKRNLLNACIIYSMSAINFYLVFIYCSTILRNDLKYSQNAIMVHNLCLCVVFLIRSLINLVFSLKIHPAKISQYILYVQIIVVLSIPLLMMEITYYKILILQVLLILFNPYLNAIDAIIIRNTPKRLTFLIASHYIARPIVYVLTSFIFLSLLNYFGYYSVYLVYIPCLLFFKKSLAYYLAIDK